MNDEKLMVLRMLIQKVEREHQAEADLADARTRYVEAWRAPEGSETLMQARKAMHDCEQAVRSTRLITIAAIYEARLVAYPEVLELVKQSNEKVA